MMHNDDDSGCDVMGKVEDNRAVTGEKDKEKRPRKLYMPS